MNKPELKTRIVNPRPSECTKIWECQRNKTDTHSKQNKSNINWRPYKCLIDLNQDHSSSNWSEPIESLISSSTSPSPSSSFNNNKCLISSENNICDVNLIRHSLSDPEREKNNPTVIPLNLLAISLEKEDSVKKNETQNLILSKNNTNNSFIRSYSKISTLFSPHSRINNKNNSNFSSLFTTTNTNTLNTLNTNKKSISTAINISKSNGTNLNDKALNQQQKVVPLVAAPLLLKKPKSSTSKEDKNKLKKCSKLKNKPKFNINAIEFCPSFESRFDHPDSRFIFTKADIGSNSEYRREFTTHSLFRKHGETELFYSKLNSDKNLSSQWITKIIHYKNDTDALRLVQENKIVRYLGLFNYNDLYHGFDRHQNNNDKHSVLMTMKLAQYDLKCAVHDLNRTKNNKHYVYNPDIFGGIDGIKRVIVDISGCLYKLHNFHYAHLDMKPGNIVWYIDDDGDLSQNGWKPIDYELMQYIAPSTGSIELNGYCGTLGYSPPEISPFASRDVNGSKNIITNKCDIWSLGISIIYILMNGKNPFYLTENDKEKLKNKNKNKNKKEKDEELIFYYLNKLNAKNKDKGEKIIENLLNSFYENCQIDIKLYYLLQSMLRYDIKERIDIIGILKHNAFSGYFKQENGEFYKKFHHSRINHNNYYQNQIPKWIKL